ncbi:tetratricopeptide repeat protein [Pedobacter metabolipauper]|uniref:Tetratricopeptide repeat protein n=1 Tax=Pedobacter metabolipauper TaxID=425513 RepID=A0A4R6SQV5_9SPHI|nr:tetratricopeptide repeat protein [Pedobacter metabolipauper]TDQ06595.1 tetratricopeptide repeat protein [Pedobacter metabolipauper]
MKKLLLLFLFSACCLISAAQDNIDDALAFQYYQQGQYEEAVVLLEKLFTRTKSDAYFDLYYNALIKLKRLDEAEKIVKKLTKQSPQNLHYTIAFARLYQEKGETAASNKKYAEAINNMPANDMKIRELANIFYSFQNYDLAISTFLQGRKILNDNQAFTYDLLSIYRFKKDKNMLIQEYLNALAAMPELLPQAESVLSNVFEDNADYQLLQAALLKKIQKEPQVETYTKLLIWQYLQQQDYEMALRQLIAQDKRTKDDGAILFNSANTFLANQAYLTAIKAYEYLVGKGKESPYFLPAKVEMINAKYELVISGKFEQQAISDLATAYYSIIDEFGLTARTVFALKKWANLQAYYLNEPGKAEKALESALLIPGLSKPDLGQIKLDLGDIYILTQQPWEAFLVYEQVAKQFENQVGGNEAHYRSAKLSYYQGNFAYAKSQADVLKASTSQLIANDALNLSLLISDNLQSTVDSNALKMYADAEMLLFRNRNTEALHKLDSIAITYPANSLTDDILMAKSRIFTKNSDIGNAVKMLQELIDKHATSIWADDALFTLAELYEKTLKDNEQAKVLYQKLINDYSGSMYTTEARKRFRKLRGDNIGT